MLRFTKLNGFDESSHYLKFCSTTGPQPYQAEFPLASRNSRKEHPAQLAHQAMPWQCIHAAATTPCSCLQERHVVVVCSSHVQPRLRPHRSDRQAASTCRKRHHGMNQSGDTGKRSRGYRGYGKSMVASSSPLSSSPCPYHNSST